MRELPQVVRFAATGNWAGRKQDLSEVGRRVRLKRNIELLTRLLESGIEGYQFDFDVVSAAPEEVVLSASHGIVPPEHVIGTRLQYHDSRQIRTLFEEHGVLIQEWDKVRTDWLTIRSDAA